MHFNFCILNNDTTPTYLGTENIGQLLIRYALPAIIAMTAASLYNITDSIFIGHGVGALALTGLGITFPLMNLSAAFGSMVGIGASTLLSIRMGQKDYQTSKMILGNVVILNVIVGIILGIITIVFLKPILFFFKANEETLPYAYDFMLIIMAGNVFTHLYYGLNAMLRSSGSPMKAMFATIATVVINLILNPLFIFGFGWGIRGSALATITSQILVLGWQIYFFSNKNYFIHFQKGVFKLKKKIVRDSLAIGMSPFLLNAASCLIIFLITQQLLKYGGNDAVGAYTIVNRVAFLFIMIIVGLNQGMQPIASYNFGADLQGRVREVLKKTMLIATLVMVWGFIIVEIFPRQVASIFTTKKELIDFAAVGLRWVFLCYPIVGFQMVTAVFFQCIGRVSKSIILSLTRQVLILIPLLLIIPNYFGVTGVWVTMPIADFISAILTAILLKRELNVKNINILPKKIRKIIHFPTY